MKTDKRQLISIYISFVAVMASVLTIVYSTYAVKSDLGLTTIVTAITASAIGVALSILYKRLTSRKYKSKIFISHSIADKEFADLIRDKLQNERFILNIDESNILVGQNVKDVINKELDTSSIVITILSKNSEQSDFVNYEIKTAIDKGKKILPVVIDEGVQIPNLIKGIKFADLRSDKRKGLNNLIKSLDYYLADEKTSP